MEFIKQIAAVFSLPEEATEAQVLAAAHAALASQVPADHVTMTAAQRDELVRNSKVPTGHEVVAAGVLETYRKEAEKAKMLETELGELKFESAFTATVDEGRATPAQKSYYKQLFEKDADLCIDMLREALPQVVTQARGDSGLAFRDAPDGVDPESHDIDRKVQAYMRDKGMRADQYTEALDIVLAQEEGR